MDHAGRRPGAGRKKVVPNRASREISRRFLESGPSPLEPDLAERGYGTFNQVSRWQDA